MRDKDRILVARVKKGNYCFLPGGHHEFGETLAGTLAREMMEETGLSVQVGRYLGIVENGWRQEDVYHQEVNHVFETVISKVSKESDIASLEDHIEFLWLSPDEFESKDLRPAIMRPLLIKWLNGDTAIWNESNLE